MTFEVLLFALFVSMLCSCTIILYMIVSYNEKITEEEERLLFTEV